MNISDYSEQPATTILAGPELVQVRFEKLEDSPQVSGLEAQVRFDLGLVRLGLDQVAVQLTGIVEDPPHFLAQVAYRAAFELQAAPRTPEARELLLREICARTAPTVLFPFVRETITNLCAKSGLGVRTLPVVDFAEVFAYERVPVPPLQAPAEASNPTPVAGQD